MKIKSKLLIIAGSDSSGGAGVQADIKTMTSLGSYAMTAITALTAQNTTGVSSIIKISSKEISKQIEYTSKDIRPDAVKIGMLHSADVIDSVIKSLRKIKAKKIILDPVMVTTSGAKLINRKAIDKIRSHLIKKVELITPNIPEAEILTKIKIISVKDMVYAAEKLIDMGAKNVLLKGGHLKRKRITDIFINKKEIKIINNKKISTKNLHGTGCSLSSAITTYFSCGKTLKRSCELAINYVNHSIKSSPNYGKGNGPINHLTSFKLDKKYL
mgnify:FL=1